MRLKAGERPTSASLLGRAEARAGERTISRYETAAASWEAMGSELAW